jgi:putative hydrolase of the HAD superfamily
VVDVMGVDPGEVLFVGDSWLPDVVGPLSAGMGAVHIWRGDERHGQDPPTLVGGAQRIGDLTALLPLVSPA